MEVKQLLGLDVGSVRIGVARASSLARLAEPLTTIKTSEALTKLQQLVDEHGVETIVVGLPRNLKGEDTDQTIWVRRWVDKAKLSLNTAFYFQDEALTSHLAEIERAAHKKPHDTDALAAAIILQDFLESPEAERAPA